MTDVRTALGQSLRDERLILSRFEWDSLDDDAQEDWRRRADHVARLLKDHGYEIIKTGEARPRPAPPASCTIVTCPTMTPGIERSVRLDGDSWSIEARDRQTGKVTVEQSFTMEEGSMVAGMVLAGDPEAQKRQGVGRLLAACLEIYRLNATRMKA